ncbi:MAG: hypothetical protein OXN81_22120 [Alphaproteobacteria bacterium]|nr:hypothetical protein [Alphaproteobacteria bacterium]
MKNDRAKKWTAAVFVGLVMAVCAPARAGLILCGFVGVPPCTPCQTLMKLTHLSSQRGTEDPTKPQNVNAELNLLGTGFSVSWDVPSNRPASTYTGFRVHFTHTSSGTTHEYQRSTSTGRTTFSPPLCVAPPKCGGTFDIYVIMKNNCNFIESVSDTISYTYDAAH